MTRLLTALLLAGWLCLPARADSVADALRHAFTLARAQDIAGAVRAMPDPLTLDPPHLPLAGRLADALRDDAPDAALRLYAAMNRLDPDALPPRVAMEQLISERPLPPTLYAEDVSFLPVEAGLVDLPPAEGIPPAKVFTIAPRPFLRVPAATDPRSGASYPHAMGGYVWRGQTLTLRFRVHYRTDAMNIQAQRAAQWLTALSIMSDAMLGPASRARYPIQVWLSPEGAPGAEQWNGAITIHGAGVERSELEWARQLAHEWGHATIPGGGGFEAPEAWAAGDLGERLFLPAVQRAGWVPHLAYGMDVTPYVMRYVEPLRLAFARTGPRPALINGRDRAAYDHYLGAALYVEAAYGMPVLAAALNDLDGPRTADLLAAVDRTLAARKEWTVARLAGMDGPAAVCFPTRGRYMLETHGAERADALREAARTHPQGWEMLDWRGALTVRRAPAGDRR